MEIIFKILIALAAIGILSIRYSKGTLPKKFIIAILFSFIALMVMAMLLDYFHAYY